MSRHVGRDEEGRPIVAELGRAETPLETAERKATARAERRGNQNALNLVIALVASFAIVAFLILVVVRPDAEPIHGDGVDYAAAAEAASADVGALLVAPELPEGWYANRAELVSTAADGVVRWELGVITAGARYLAVTQGLEANPSWVADRVRGAAPSGSIELGGVEWTAYDRRAADDPGNLEFALVAEFSESTLVLGGTADDAEFATLAEAVAEELSR